ncbi:MAG: excalibur calcium-binding domain-containing protein [Dehalococcoidia bacterium]
MIKKLGSCRVGAGGPGVDRHRLDGDNDGVACESLAGALGFAIESLICSDRCSNPYGQQDTWANRNLSLSLVSCLRRTVKHTKERTILD